MTHLIIFLILLSLGYFIGQYNEKRHYLSIRMREKQLISIATTTSKHPINERDVQYHKPARLVSGAVVISVDYFKLISAALRGIFGGNISTYETLLDRGRREAVLRMKESCPGAKQIINLRIETSSIFKGEHKQTGSIEVFAYGTAVY